MAANDVESTSDKQAIGEALAAIHAILARMRNNSHLHAVIASSEADLSVIDGAAHRLRM